MDSLIHKINLDCLRKDSQAIVNAKIGEASGRKIVFTLYEGRAPFFVPSGTTVVFRAKKPSGAVLYNNCVVDDGKIEYTITSQTVAEKGVFPCEIQIIGTDSKVIYTPCITLNVTENLYSDSEIESSDEYSALTEALQSLPSAEVLNGKQDKLIAGENITIADDGKTISAKGVGVLEVTLTTQNGVSVADKTFEQVKAAVDSGIPVLKVHSDGAISWFFLLDKSPTEIDFVGLVDEQIIAYLTAKQDGTWETTVAARVTEEMLSSLNDKIGNLNDLDTEAKNNLVAAINEAAQTGGGGGGSASIAMRVDSGYIQYSTDKGKTWVNLIAEADLKGGKGDKGDPGTPGKDGAPGVYYGTTQPTGDTHPVWINPDGDHDDGGLLPAVTAFDNGKVLRVVSGAWGPADMPTSGTDMGITGATVGQIAKITAVDASGVPTAWSPVDMPSGGGGSSEGIGELRRIAKVTLTEDAASIEITTDENGNAFELVEYTYLIMGKSLGTSGNIGLKINDALIYYETNLSNTNTTVILISGGHGSYVGGWYATYKASFNANRIDNAKSSIEHNIGKMKKFWYGCTSGVAGVGFQAGTVLELWGR